MELVDRIPSQLLRIGRAIERGTIEVGGSPAAGVEHHPPTVARNVEVLYHLLAARNLMGLRNRRHTTGWCWQTPDVRRLGERVVRQARSVGGYGDGDGVQPGGNPTGRRCGVALAVESHGVDVAAAFAIRHEKQSTVGQPCGTPARKPVL